MTKLDLTKTDKTYYQAGSKPVLVEVNPYHYLIISGVSAPEDPQFTSSIEALYAMAYALKFNSKSNGSDFKIPKMEGQWWVEGDLPFEQTPRNEWHWNLMIPMPDVVTEKDFERLKPLVMDKKKLEKLKDLRFEPMKEGISAQVLHIGSYDEEAPTLEKLFDFIEIQGMQIAGYHHEIYLSDPQRTSPEKLRTILRYPVHKKR